MAATLSCLQLNVFSIHFFTVFSYCLWDSWGKNTEMVCHSLFQWTTFCQNSPPWPVHFGWPYTHGSEFHWVRQGWVHVIRLVSFLWLWFSFCLPSAGEEEGFPGGSYGKESACNAGDLGSIPGSGRSPGEANGTPLQYSCLENPMDGGAWWAIVQGVTKSQTRLNDFTHFYDFTIVWKQYAFRRNHTLNS